MRTNWVLLRSAASATKQGIKPITDYYSNKIKTHPLYRPAGSTEKLTKEEIKARTKKTLIVEDEDHGMKYEDFIQKKLNLARNIARLKIINGQCLVSSFTARENVLPAKRMVAGGSVTILGPDQELKAIEQKNLIRARAINMDKILKGILYKDEKIMVINKPCGLPMSEGTKVKFHLSSFLEHLKFGNDEEPHIVHYIPKDVSGIVVLARKKCHVDWLTKTVADDRVAIKTYFAILCQPLPPSENKVDLKTVESGLTKVGQPPNEKYSVIEYHPSFEGQRYPDENPIRQAITDYIVLSSSSMGSHVKLIPRTNIPHQLRVHCARLLHAPILGDYKYGSGFPAHLKSTEHQFNRNHLQLHLGMMTIKDYFGPGTFLKVAAPLPQHMNRALKILGLKYNPSRV